MSGQLKGQLRVNDGTTEPPLALQQLFQPLPYVLRLYVLRGIGLNPKDANGYLFLFNQRIEKKRREEKKKEKRRKGREKKKEEEKRR